MELGPEDGSLLERCPYFRGWYVQASMGLDVSLLERCPHFIIHHLILSLIFPQATVRCLEVRLAIGHTISRQSISHLC